jgi:hypothetical protein
VQSPRKLNTRPLSGDPAIGGRCGDVHLVTGGRFSPTGVVNLAMFVICVFIHMQKERRN